eukprot:TRINITY_DN13492_c0_g1_i2.p1 TRINITY_DN13492_c0_g1~~TRINITY_DN13492_c0_g1_i2.p1  ORF type:complete len:193 (+),score=27.39 TRINITY_DN13492_c0_g1_i2:155-733(+)
MQSDIEERKYPAGATEPQSPCAGSLRVHVLGGESLHVRAKDADTVLDVKVQIEKELSAPLASLCLIHAGQELQDGLTLSSRNISTAGDATVYLLCRGSAIPGGSSSDASLPSLPRRGKDVVSHIGHETLRPASELGCRAARQATYSRYRPPASPGENSVEWLVKMAKSPSLRDMAEGIKKSSSLPCLRKQRM